MNNRCKYKLSEQNKMEWVEMVCNRSIALIA